MLEPSPRYSPTTVGGGPTTRLQLDTSLETAVDLSRKSATSDIGLKAEVEAEQDDSEDEAPLDLKVEIGTSSCDLNFVYQSSPGVVRRNL